MGIDNDGLRFLRAARRDGVDFTRTCTIGRQSSTADEFPQPYADELLASLGAVSVDSLDASDYEGATIVHDLNSPTRPAGQFSCVIDGGTLEHVFHVPNALDTILGLVEPGGHVVFVNPTDGHPGHGFYQFSPEFYWRVLDDGFTVKRCLLKEYGERRPWFDVPDPAKEGRRVIPRVRGLASIYVLAQRTGDRDGVTPQQSDYEATWREGSSTGRALELIQRLPGPLQRRLWQARERVLRWRGPASVGLARVEP